MMKKYIKLANGGFYDPEDPRLTAIKRIGLFTQPELKPMNMIGSSVPMAIEPGTPVQTGIPTGRKPLSTTLLSRTSPNIPDTPVKPIGSRFNLDNITKGAKSAAPFVSNITNSFRHAPRPSFPMLDSSSSLQKVSLAGERYNVSRATQGANKSAERNVDANTAEVIKQFNNAGEFDKLSSINERESNVNSDISNKQTMMDMQVKMSNTDKINDFRTAQTAAKIADQREQSSNIANAGDKIVGVQNEKDKAALDLNKTRVLASVFSQSGVMDRNRARLKASGIPDPLGIDYKDLEEKKAYGGMMRKVPSKKLY